MQIAVGIGFDGRFFQPGEGEHAGGKVLHALGVDQQILQAGLILLGGARIHGEQLQAGFEDGDRGLELVRGVAGELALALKGLMQTIQQLLDRQSDGREFGRVEDLARGDEVPGARRDVTSDCCQLLQRREPAAKKPDQRDASGSQQQNASEDVKADGLQSLVPEIVCGRGVEHDDRTMQAAGCLVAVDDAKALKAQDAVVLLADAKIEVLGCGRRRDEGSECGELLGRCLRRSADDAAVGVDDLVEVLMRDIELGRIDYDVVVRVFGVLHRAQQGIGAAAQHHVEGAAAAVHLMQNGHSGEERGAGKLGKQDTRD